MPGSNLQDQNLGSVIREARENAGMSSRQLAIQAGIRPSTILRIETGYSENPDAKNLQAIARVLKMDVEETICRCLGTSTAPDCRNSNHTCGPKYGITDDAAQRIEGYVQAFRDVPTANQPQSPKEETDNDHDRADSNP